MDISIIIPSYNTEQTIEKTLTRLEAQETTSNFEIIIVDCSEHEKIPALCKKYPHTRCIRVAKRFNPGIGRNIGANEAQGQLLIFVDSDVQLSKNTLNNAWQHFQQGSTAFGGALELNEEECSDSSAYLEHYFFNHESQANRPECERSNLSSAFMCFDKELFLKSGGFKDIPRMQDTELTERLTKEHSIKLKFYPDLIALQTQDSKMSKVLRKIYINGQNLYYIRYDKNNSIAKRLLMGILLPAVGAAKTLRIIGRHLKYQPTPKKVKTLALSPLLIPAGITWTLGFYHALITQKGMGTQR